MRARRTGANRRFARNALYWVALALYRFLFFAVFGGRIRRLGEAQAGGPLVIMSNHAHALDPLTLALCVPRRQVHFMGKKELFRNPLAARLLRALHCIPVDRGQSDLTAMREAMAVLRAGHALGIFPEGHRGDGKHLGEMLSGAGLLALRSDAPVLPVYIQGPYGVFRRPRVVVGAPLDITDLRQAGADREGAEAFSRRLRAALEELASRCAAL